MSSDLEFHSLEGISGGRAWGTMCRSAAQMVRELGKHQVTSAAGDEGALTAWVGDDGRYRAAFTRWMSAVASGDFSTKTELRVFLDKWYPAMRDVHALSEAMAA